MKSMGMLPPGPTEPGFHPELLNLTWMRANWLGYSQEKTTSTAGCSGVTAR